MISLSAGLAQGQSFIRDTFVATGDARPGGGTFGHLAIDGQGAARREFAGGHLAFVDRAGEDALYRRSHFGATELVAQVGAAAADTTGGETYVGVFDWSLDDDARIGFRAAFDGATPSDDQAFYGEDAGGVLRVFAREGDVPPQSGTANALERFEEARVFHYGGEISILALRRVPTSPGSITYRHTPNFGIEWVYREGTLISGGIGVQSVFEDPVEASWPTINTFGMVFLSTILTRDAGSAIIEWVPGAIPAHLYVQLEGWAVPGLAGVTYSRFERTPRVNKFSQLAFDARFGGATVTDANDEGALAPDGSGDARLVIREGDAVPGVAGAVFGAPTTEFLNESGASIHTAPLDTSGSVTSSVWEASPPGTTTLRVREGDAVPFLAGAVYGPVAARGYSNAGSLLIEAQLEGGGVVDSDNRVLVVIDASGVHWPVLREGESLVVRTGVVRTVPDRLEEVRMDQDGTIVVALAFALGDTAILRIGFDTDGDGIPDYAEL
ncbi:MAG: choice-of-anchor tandem repeat NxxGxxAF-containing protein [Myxococcota bacterium]